jgi:hypothetical protein
VSRTDEDKFVAAIVRKFRAVEVEPPPPPPATSSTPERDLSTERKCVLCRRDLRGRMVGPDADGRWWCPKSETDKCDRIAAGRLGASASGGSASSLRGIIEADGKCRDCGEPVKWVKTQRGKKMPVNIHPAPKAVDAFELVGEHDTLAFYVSEKRRAKHWGDTYEFHGSTCEGRRGR